MHSNHPKRRTKTHRTTHQTTLKDAPNRHEGRTKMGQGTHLKTINKFGEVLNFDYICKTKT